MDTYYTSEVNTQITIALLKAHNIRKVVVSPGAMNIQFVASIQQDGFFEMYSSVDERSAAYIACGLAAESGEPVVLSCTGATASRNYIPALTEAYYRKLPIIAITSTQYQGRIGHNIAQVLDRTIQLNDIVNLSVQVRTTHCEEDEWACGIAVNKALLELCRNAGGPVHINLETTYSQNFSVKELPKVNPIYRIVSNDKFPDIPQNKRVAIFVGAHVKWSDDFMRKVDEFCEKYNAVVLCDHTSNYKGKYRVLFNLVTDQIQSRVGCSSIDLLIHIGDISGAYPGFSVKKVWRVNSDGEIRDTFKKLSYVFEMKEIDFFSIYNKDAMVLKENTQIIEWDKERERIQAKIPELPFSNLWLASVTADKLPENSVLHLAILNSLRSWNFFEVPNSVLGYSNTGGFGIDGCLSSALGASLAHKDKLYYLVIGDLAFFYDLNALGNRHIGNNLRILLINNGIGGEFKNYKHQATMFREEADDYIAASGHFGKQSRKLVKNFAEDLGFEYAMASTKEEYMEILPLFITPTIRNKSMILEVFTDSKDESDALYIMKNLDKTVAVVAKNAVKGVIGDKGVKNIKKLLGK